MYTHIGTVKTIKNTYTVKLKEFKTVWQDAGGRKYLKTTGKRPMDSGNGVVLVLSSVKAL